MSRILKASFVNVEQNVVIDNTFVPNQFQNEHMDATQLEQEVEYLEENEPSLDLEHLEKVKEEIVYEAHLKAEQIVQEAKENAEKEAQKIIEDAEQIAQQKIEQAYNEGFEKGSSDAIENAHQEAEQIRQEAKELLEQTQKEREETIQSLEPQMMKFVLDIAQNVLTTAFELNSDIIKYLIQKGLQSVKEIKNLKIYVSEDNYDYVEQNKKEIVNTDTEQHNIEIAKDTTLQKMDCIIETEIGTIRCGLDEQLSGIKEALRYILN